MIKCVALYELFFEVCRVRVFVGFGLMDLCDLFVVYFVLLHCVFVCVVVSVCVLLCFMCVCVFRV